MTLKVIGAGFGRTGTASTKAALERLGYSKCHHMHEVLSNAKQIDAWHRISQGEGPDWDAVFDSFEASVDFPSAGYWEELADYFPDAKIVLTTRSFESWYESASDTIYAVTTGIRGWLLIVPRARKIKEMVYGTIWDRVFHGQFENKSAAKAVFEKHEADVKAAFPAERLLVFHPKEGWEPLCAFLGKPVPAEPFPNVNDREDFRTRVTLLGRLRVLPWVLCGLTLAAIATYAAFQ